jgi:bifunctional DNase/RNase
MVDLLRATGGRIERVAVTALRDKTFYATISVAVDGRSEELDARPSDALNLAVRVGAEIVVDEAVLENAAITPEGLEEKLEREADAADMPVPPGTWTSLSTELLRALHQFPKAK